MTVRKWKKRETYDNIINDANNIVYRRSGVPTTSAPANFVPAFATTTHYLPQVAEAASSLTVGGDSYTTIADTGTPWTLTPATSLAHRGISADAGFIDLSFILKPIQWLRDMIQGKTVTVDGKEIKVVRGRVELDENGGLKYANLSVGAYVDSYENGRLGGATLSEAQEIQDIMFAGGTQVEFYENGRLKFAKLSESDEDIVLKQMN